jgi:hypothetical protein
LNRWVERLDALHVERSPVRHSGEAVKFVAFEDPDGIRLEFYVYRRAAPAATMHNCLGARSAAPNQGILIPYPRSVVKRLFRMRVKRFVVRAG